MIDVTKIGLRVRVLRHRAGLSQTELADAAGVHVNTLRILERGGAPHVSVQTLDKIGTVLGERIGVLIHRARAVQR